MDSVNKSQLHKTSAIAYLTLAVMVGVGECYPLSMYWYDFAAVVGLVWFTVSAIVACWFLDEHENQTALTNLTALTALLYCVYSVSTSLLGGVAARFLEESTLIWISSGFFFVYSITSLLLLIRYLRSKY